MDAHRDAIRAADELARLLSDGRGTATIRALQRLSRVRGRGGTRRRADPPAFSLHPGRIGIWDIVATDRGRALRRRRDVSPGESSTWASVDQVPGKGDARRVVLVGESAARGYLLDPVYNPALGLQRHLDAAPDGPRHQCVDLAHTSVELVHLRHLIRATAHLEADVLVMFAGNNWTISAYQVTDPDTAFRLAGALREEGYPGLRRTLLDRVLVPQVHELLADLLRVRDRAGVRPVVVVPEFNLTGWSPLGPVDAVDVPMLPGDAVSRWYDAKARALAALAAGAWSEVRVIAGELVTLDGGLSPVPGYLLGSALAAQGDHPAARVAFEQARDSVCGLMVKYLPRIPRLVQDMLVEFCGRHDIACVDLRRLLGRADAPELPDPQYFLDYCHLSDTGIDRAMAAVAAHITGGTGEPATRPPTVGDRERAVSLVLAAAYNSFCGQPTEVVRGYLTRALAASRQVRELLGSLDRLLARPGPAWASPDLDALAREPNAAMIFERLSDYRPNQSRLWTLRESLSAVLRLSTRDSHRVGELLDISSTMMGVGAVRNYTAPRCYLQANVRCTEVRFALPEPVPGVLRLTHRRRTDRPDGARLELNGAAVGRFVAGTRWSASEFPVPAAMTRRGVNIVRVNWPAPTRDLEARVAEDVDALIRGKAPYVLPEFGELYSMTFRPGEVARVEPHD